MSVLWQDIDRRVGFLLAKGGQGGRGWVCLLGLFLWLWWPWRRFRKGGRNRVLRRIFLRLVLRSTRRRRRPCGSCSGCTGRLWGRWRRCGMSGCCLRRPGRSLRVGGFCRDGVGRCCRGTLTVMGMWRRISMVRLRISGGGRFQDGTRRLSISDGIFLFIRRLVCRGGRM